MRRRARRAFRVHARHADDHRAHVLQETSFEAAAVAYIEDFLPGADDESEIRIVVRDLGNGHEHCFRIDLETGGTLPCA